MWELILVGSINLAELNQRIVENPSSQILESEKDERELLRILEDIFNNEEFLRKLQQEKLIPFPAPNLLVNYPTTSADGVSDAPFA